VFDHVSIRPAPPLTAADASTANPKLLPGGVFRATHTTVYGLMMFAWDLKPYQMAGGPEWAKRDLFRVEASAAMNASLAQVRLMVRSMLEERFQLVASTESRELPLGRVVVARQDGQLGPYIRKMPDACTPALAAEALRQFPPRERAQVPGMTGQCMRLFVIADRLAARAGYPVVDNTRLDDKYVWDLRYDVGAKPVALADIAPVAVAMEEQLGLRLEFGSAPVNVLVIESMEKPFEN
jgi:uncharacterized protein (TIGR03435 family)